MAGPTNPNDPNRIDISLGLTGEGSLAAIDQLVEQMSKVTEHLAQFNKSVAGQTDIQTSMASRFRPGTGVHEGVSPTASRGGHPSIADGAGQNASAPFPERSPLRRLKDYVGNPRGAVETEVGYQDQRERAQHDRRARAGLPDFDLSGIGGSGGGYGYDFGNTALGGYVDGGAGPGQVSPNASYAPGAYDNMPTGPNAPTGRNALTANRVDWEKMQEGVRLPPGGLSMNLQDKLRLLSNVTAGHAERQLTTEVESSREKARAEALNMGWSENDFNKMIDDENYSGVGSRRFNAAALMRSASSSNALVGLQAIGGDVKRAGTRAYAYGSGLQGAGIEAGNARAGQINIPGTGIGITNPFDFFAGGSAAREGLNQRINVQRLRMKGGITGAQADTIVGGLAGMGWTGEEGQNMAFDAVAPLVQQGLNPQVTIEQMDKAMRLGNTSVADFKKTLTNLGPAAKEARMSLTEFQQSIGGFADWAKQNGATYNQGMQLGRGVSTAMGLAPPIVQSMASNPMMQIGAFQQGFMPWDLAQQSPSQMVQSFNVGLDLAMKAGDNLPDIPGQPGSKRASQIALAAQLTGQTPEVIRHALKTRAASPIAARLQQAGGDLDRYDASAGKVHKQLGNGQADVVHGTINPGEWELSNQQTRGAQKIGGQWFVRATETGYGTKLSPEYAAAMHQLQTDKTSGWSKSRSDLIQLANAGHLNKKDRSEFDKAVHNLDTTDPVKRKAAADKLIDETMKKIGGGPAPDNRPQVLVKFTGAAERYFTQLGVDPSKDNAQRGGTRVGVIGPATARVTAQKP